jgi:dTDP-4-dehydrorhamnose reductase
MAAAPDCLIIAARLADPAATGRCTQAEFEAGFRALIAAFLKPGHRDVPCKIVYVSSDAVFRGDKGPYRETDSPDATSDYGLRHRRAEEILMEEHESALIVRPSYLFDGTPDALDKRLARLKRILSAGRSLELATNIHKSPAPVSDAARQIIDGAFSGRTGIMHVAAPRMSLYEFYAHGLELLGLQEFAAKLVPVTDQKPNDTSLVSSLTELTV